MSTVYTISTLRNRTFCVSFLISLCQCILALCSCSLIIFSIIFYYMNLVQCFHFSIDRHYAFKLHFHDYSWGWTSFHILIVRPYYHLLSFAYFLLFVLTLLIFKISPLSPSLSHPLAVTISFQCIACLFNFLYGHFWWREVLKLKEIKCINNFLYIFQESFINPRMQINDLYCLLQVL